MAHSAEALLEAATKTASWLSSQQHETDHGVIWSIARETPERRLRTLYYGSAGIALFLLELWQATGDERYRDLARRAGDDIVNWIGTKETLPIATHGGWAGYFFALNELSRLTGEPAFLETATLCAQKLRDQATTCGSGIGWITEMPYARLTGHSGTRELYDVAEGAAGIGIYYLYAHENGIHPEALNWVRDIAERLLEVAEEATGGLRWQLMDDIPWPFDAPNFAHGTAGVAYFLARAFEATADRRLLDAAIAGARHVQAMAEGVGDDAWLVPHVLNDGRDNRYYLGFCHGPAGTSRLYYLLSRITGNADWRDWSAGLDRGLVAIGAPETRGRGFWNNISQCCCDAGIGDYATSMYRETSDGFYLDLADRVADELLRRSEENEFGLCWPQAEHRTQPDFLQAQAGYMQGAAGVASFLTHLATVKAGRPVKIRLPESPFIA